MVDIEPGETLTFTRDENITAEVVDDKKIRYKNQEMSLTRATKRIMKEEYGFERKKAAWAGPRHWIV